MNYLFKSILLWLKKRNFRGKFYGYIETFKYRKFEMCIRDRSSTGAAGTATRAAFA